MWTSSTTSCPATTPWCTSPPSRTSTGRSREHRTSSSPTSWAPRPCCRPRSTPGSAAFVHVSTDEVYGSIPEGSWDENRPLEPNSPYSASKAGSDLLARAYARTFGMEVCITRCSNNYGPHQFPEKVIPLFVTNLMDGLQVPLYGEGLNVRDWLHVDDHCRGINLVLAKGRAGETYNIGGGTELTNIELTERLLAAMGVGWEMVRRVEDRKGHDLRYSVDITKISDELGYAPRGPVRAGPGRHRRVVQGQRGLVASAQGSEARSVSDAAVPIALARRRSQRDARSRPHGGHR